MDESPLRVVAFAAAVVPPIIIFIYFLAAARVRIDTEMIWGSFGFGACAAFPAVMVAKFIEITIGYGAGFYEMSAKQAYFGAAVPEEVFKFVALLCLCGQQFHKLQPNHLFALAIGTGCGFAGLENIFYVVESESWRSTAYLRSVSAVPGHAFVGAIMGFCVIRAARGPAGFVWWGLALILPITLHGAYDFFLFALSNLKDVLAGATGDLAQVFVLLFILTVIIVGAMAHLSLRIVLNMVDFRQELVQGMDSKPAVVGWLQRASEHPLGWGILGILCLLVAGAFFWDPVTGTDTGGSVPGDAIRSFGQGFAAFAALHGTAFVGLAVVVWRRSRLR